MVEFATKEELKRLRPKDRERVIEAEGEYRKAQEHVDDLEAELPDARAAARIAERELRRLYESLSW